jgi:ribonuclease-3
MNRADLLRFQNSCGYTFKNDKLLDEALTHDSNRVNDRSVPTYQRLEFLGDSVLNLVVSEYLFLNYPNFTEGQLTDKRKELTEAKKQIQIAEKLNLKDHILFGQSVRRDQYTGHHSFVESIIGAVYIDGGLDKAKELIRRLWELSGNSNTAQAAAGSCVIS